MDIQFTGRGGTVITEVIDWINQRHPDFLPKKKDGSILKNKAEHIADALLTIYTGLNK